MIHMQEEEFDKIEKSNEKCPPHKVVKLYYKGTHSDYGCVKCKLTHIVDVEKLEIIIKNSEKQTF